MRYYRLIRKFLREDLWNKPLRELKGIKRFCFRFLRVIAVSFRGFVKNHCVLRASALTYFTLLSIVPLFTISLGVSQWFGLKERLHEEIMERFADQKDVLAEVLKLSQAVLDKTKGGILALLAMLFLFWSVMKLISNMESAFNQIWHANEKRSWRRKLGIYFFLLFLFPFFFLFSNGVKVYFVRLIPDTIQNEIVTKGSQLFYSLMPFVIIWLFFVFIYAYLPKKKVKLLPALIGGFVAGAIYEAIQWGYVVFQIGVSRYSGIYGSFAALPFFLISLQLGWMVFLYGAEIAHGVQYPQSCESEKKAKKVAFHYEILLALWVTLQVIERTLKNKQPLMQKDLYLKMGIPESLGERVLSLLTKAQVLTAMKQKRRQNVLLIFNGSIDDVKVMDIVERIITAGENDFPVRSNPLLQKTKEVLKGMYEKLSMVEENTLMKDLIH